MGDIFTEQLAGDKFIEQQQRLATILDSRFNTEYNRASRVMARGKRAEAPQDDSNTEYY